MLIFCLLWCDAAQGAAGVVPVDPGGGFAFACFSTCPGRDRIVYGASSWFPNNVACNFPVNLLCIEIVSLQFQRFWVVRKVRSVELHATFGRAAFRLPLNRTCQGLVGETPRPHAWGSGLVHGGEAPASLYARTHLEVCEGSQLRLPLASGR